ncbi:MAG: aminotransferase class I/II-fold pyridoxal phosphate-dependent enzyme [Planctomycetes bacterium]|nr:aminotransferase class I/II-fold pyridoxal phosphate-dependent enzyme [Planctomycetota bacterium]
MIDLRSDTVTWPTESMYRAMRVAPLGDDVFGDDPTVIELEKRAAALLGFEAALFAPSGTMANSIAIGVATRPGDEMLVMEDAHVFLFEQGGAARLWGVQPRTLPTVDGCPAPEQIEGAIRPDDPHFPRTSLVCLENTHNMRGGIVIAPERIAAIGEVCRRHGLHLHLDGARLFNAAAALDRPVTDLTAPVDSVMISLSKGLQCPVGSIYASSASHVAHARRLRKLLGGGMRQAGILASCGLVALNDPTAVLREDHRRAREIAGGLGRIDELRVTAPETNIVMVELHSPAPGDYRRLTERLGQQEVRVVNILDRRIRLVTHARIGDDAVPGTIRAFELAVADLR